MTRANLACAIANETGMTQKDVTNVMESFFRNVSKSLKNREEVVLRGFGTFSIKHKAAKQARNISKGVAITIPERDVPVFKPSKYL